MTRIFMRENYVHESNGVVAIYRAGCFYLPADEHLEAVMASGVAETEVEHDERLAGEAAAAQPPAGPEPGPEVEPSKPVEIDGQKGGGEQ